MLRAVSLRVGVILDGILFGWSATTRTATTTTTNERVQATVHETRYPVQGKTSPPDYLTEADLIGLMEQHGIGTDASISVHVHNVCERGYLRVEAGRRVVPTDLGITLISGYQRIDPELCRPQVLLHILPETVTMLLSLASYYVKRFVELLARNTGKAFQKGGTCPHAEVA